MKGFSMFLTSGLALVCVAAIVCPVSARLTLFSKFVMKIAKR